MKEFMQKNIRSFLITGGIFLFLIIGAAGAFGYHAYQKYQAEKQVGNIHAIIGLSEYSRSNCDDVLSFDIEKIDHKKVLFHKKQYENFYSECEKKFDILQQEQTLEFCEKIISGKKSSFQEKYIVGNNFKDVQKQCSLTYLSVTFSQGKLFDVESDFKSSVEIKFGLPFYEDTKEVGTDEFIENRTQAKERFLDLLKVTPALEITVDDIVLHPRSGTLLLKLEPETEYTFALKSYDAKIHGEKMASEKLTFKTPENTYFGLRKIDKVSLFQDTNAVDFELISYNTEKTSTKVKMCRIKNEDYAKIEAFHSQEGIRQAKREFFVSGINDLSAYECFEKNVSFQGDQEEKMKKVVFNFSEFIGKPARSGLYYMTFSDAEEREYAGIVQEPMLFGVIDSHITMKISKNGKGFFFVNDLEGKPLAGQKIRAYVNDFQAYIKEWDHDEQEYIVHYKNPLETSVFDAPVLLGETNGEGVLEVDMKEKVDDAFGKTFSGSHYSWDGNYDSFFITSASDNNLTYLSSKWNGGISDWNFGYSSGSGWWYHRSQNMDEITLKRWGKTEPSVYSHVYTDRRLYLPGEQVHIKALIRNSEDLSIPQGKEIVLKIRNSKGEDIKNSVLKVNEYGSLYDTITLPKNAKLGNYLVLLYAGDRQIGQTGFSVEVFKNPKFSNEVMLKTVGLNEELVKNVQVEKEITRWGYNKNSYTSKFEIQANIHSSYYSGPPVSNALVTYKVYKQPYYDDSYWDDCYYGCYWQPQKELYTEGSATLDEYGRTDVNIPVEFSSYYQDYKYIVEVTVVDDSGEKISGSNSVIARLPSVHKRWNPDSNIHFKTAKRFYKVDEEFDISGGLTHGDFSQEYYKNFLFLIKKKEYTTTYVKDIRGYNRPITRATETIQSILPVNDKNFILKDGKLSLRHSLPETGEYIFEFGSYDRDLYFNVDELIEEFKKNGGKDIFKDYSGTVQVNWNSFSALQSYCDRNQEDCSSQAIAKKLGCKTDRLDNTCRGKEVEIAMKQRISLSDLIDSNSRKYFTLISYGDINAKNPVESDNKITVLSEKVSYKLGEKARILVRLPFSNGKILWTVEKQGVVDYEYIDVPGNTFFKEIDVDDTFVPNAYIGVVVVDTDDQRVPEYKVGYTEIVVDKSDKKSEITLKTDKETYEPRDQVTLDINARVPSELTVMVVDDSLISLMGNIDTNTLEKFYKKLPFQVQTSITNIGMLRNYYFSRQGIVGGSGFGNFKGGDSAVSSRNIFKNTAYYNPSVITDANGRARLQFTLPDNLTNFRVMVMSHSKDNFFGYSEDMIEVRKDVIVQDRTPLILREGDSVTLGAQVFNTTEKTINFRANISSKGLEIETKERDFSLKAGASTFLSWEAKNLKPCGYLEQECQLPYTISVLGDSAKHSDMLEGVIEIVSIPSLLTHVQKNEILEVGEEADLTLALPENTDISKSLYTLSLSNNPLQGIEKIITSLAVYPFGCGEQLLSSTMPNAILQRFTYIFSDLRIEKDTVTQNLNHGLSEIYKMSLPNGAFKYWYNDTQGNAYITAYGVRVLKQIQDAGITINTKILNNAADYLVQNYSDMTGTEKTESLWAIASYYGKETEKILGVSDLEVGYDSPTLKRHDLIAFTYGLVLANPEKYKKIIDANIVRITTLLHNNNSGSHYYSKLGDMAEFTQLLMDFGYSQEKVSGYILELYQKDWSSYWYSTKTKNNAFLAFVKYIELYEKDSLTTLSLSLNGKTKEMEIGKKKNSYAQEMSLKDVLKNEQVSLQVKNISGVNLFASTHLKSYPLDPSQVPPFSHGVSMKRKIYEVTDSGDIKETCQWKNGDRICTQAGGLKLHTGDIFKKGVTYKVVLEAEFSEYERREHLTIEDYIPAGLSILNNNFKTNEIATSQNTSASWSWSHVEKRPDLLMAYAKTTWGTKASYQYFVRADFSGDFIYPPAVVYLMYQPDTRANTTFRRVVIEE